MNMFFHSFRFFLILFLLSVSSCNYENTAQEIYSMGMGQFQEGNYKDADKSFIRAIEIDSAFAEAYFMHAQILAIYKKDKDSICYLLEKSEKLGFEQARKARKEFCMTYSQEEIEKKMSLLNAFINAYPYRVEAYVERGNLYFDLREYDKAIEEYNIVLGKLDFPEAYYNRGLCYFLKGMRNRGCEDINKAAKLGYSDAMQLKICD
jgi:tetratricopeptide (TPR) repeat protein